MVKLRWVHLLLVTWVFGSVPKHHLTNRLFYFLILLQSSILISMIPPCTRTGSAMWWTLSKLLNADLPPVNFLLETHPCKLPNELRRYFLSMWVLAFLCIDRNCSFRCMYFTHTVHPFSTMVTWTVLVVPATLSLTESHYTSSRSSIWNITAGEIEKNCGHMAWRFTIISVQSFCEIFWELVTIQTKEG